MCRRDHRKLPVQWWTCQIHPRRAMKSKHYLLRARICSRFSDYAGSPTVGDGECTAYIHSCTIHLLLCFHTSLTCMRMHWSVMAGGKIAYPASVRCMFWNNMMAALLSSVHKHSIHTYYFSHMLFHHFPWISPPCLCMFTSLSSSFLVPKCPRAVRSSSSFT